MVGAMAREYTRAPPMAHPSALSVHNLAYFEELYEAYRRDPSSIDPDMRAALESGDAAPDLAPPASRPAGTASYAGPAQDPVSWQGTAAGAAELEHLRLQRAVDELIEAFRLHGHLGAAVDPLGQRRNMHAPMLDPAYWGITPAHLARTDLLFASGGLFDQPTSIQAIIARLRDTYTSSIGVEYWHLPDREERDWLQAKMESTANRVVPDLDTQKHLLATLVNVDTVDNFLHQKFLGAKRFSVAGGESVIAVLDQLIEHAGDYGVGEVIFGMAHRGRLNVLMNVMGKSPAEVFSEFEKASDARSMMGAGDVKYHMGYHREHVTRHGVSMYLALAFNPSHLEAITPVIQGRVRAKQDSLPDRGFDASVGVSLHGDAAFAGQGVVAETLNMAELEGYTVGGVVRVVINNQVGFTTNPHESRSGPYCTDIAHILQVPVFHVNGDDVEACAYVAKLALDFRQRFRRDVVIDLVCYRRFGHNEGDDPTFTQPLLYDIISKQRPVSAIYADTLVERGSVTRADVEALRTTYLEEFNNALTKVRSEGKTGVSKSPMHGMWERYNGGAESQAGEVDTTITQHAMERYAKQLVAVPQDFNMHKKVARLLSEQEPMLRGEAPLSWAAAELLAYASLVDQGHPVRLSGQDAMRGTFSHRHAAWVDEQTGARFSPLSQIGPNQARFEVYNSPLSEFSVLGFEFGYTLAAPNALVIWEAQFGDFANGAQVMIDQFISSSEDKWNRISGLVMMLPHGFEGQGPEHSSARLERFLQLCAEDNMQVCNLSTPSQLFHALRRQVMRNWRKPLILMSPKSPLRYRPCYSPKEEFISGGFSRVIDDASQTVASRGRVTKIILTTGKVHFDLLEERARLAREDVALIRVEQLYPWPESQLRATLSSYPASASVTWLQEEPRNMGAWSFVAPRLAQLISPARTPEYIGRDESASPATGSPDAHQLERQLILEAAFA